MIDQWSRDGSAMRNIGTSFRRADGRDDPAMTLKTCLRCDWQGETTEPGCPSCGTRPLYVLGASPPVVEAPPVKSSPGERRLEAPSAATLASSDTSSPLPTPSPPPTDASVPRGPIRPLGRRLRPGGHRAGGRRGGLVQPGRGTFGAGVTNRCGTAPPARRATSGNQAGSG